MKVSTKQKKEISLERRIGDRCREVEGLSFGYIGNFERWGDDRKLFIWIKEDKMRAKNGNQASLWSCVATGLDTEAAIKALVVIRGFEAGKKYNSHQS
jgi:hypothetical protein|tara:strand:- start:1349 stop:1642 length:294 start_codon:yes stop_codon:yes gene_type:complete